MPDVPEPDVTDLPDVPDESDVRPLELEDVAGCEEVWHDAFLTMRVAYHLPARPPDDADRTRLRRRISLLRASDAGGSWVAVARDEVAGFAQAFVRDGLWVLSLLGVAVSHQGRGLARRLLERAVAYGDASGPGLIMSSRDPRAMHRYVQAGFALHPSVAASGTIRRSRLVATPQVRDGNDADLELVARIDRRVRGSAHGPELSLLLEESRLAVVPDRGYALVRPNGVAIVAALDEDTATQLLVAGLAATPEGATVDVNWMTGAQQWAIRTCTDLGLELHPAGAVMVRGSPGPLAPYIPNGAFG